MVAPPGQTYVPPPLAVRVALAPAQIIPSLLVAPEVSVTAMDADGSELMVTVTEPVIVVVQLLVVLAVAVQPLVVTVTV